MAVAGYDPLDASLISAPELTGSPTLAVSNSLTSSDPSGTGQALAHVQNLQAVRDAYDNQAQSSGGHSLLGKTIGWFGTEAGHLIHPVATAGGALLHLANMPLQEVQHQYRYLHDVWDRYGATEAILEALPMIGATTAGTLVGAPHLGILAGEAMTGIEGRLLHTDSWDRTTDGNAYLDPSGRKISMGRDIASLLHIGGAKHEGLLPGVIDGIADLTADPLGLLGKAATVGHGAEAIEQGAELGKLPGLSHVFGGLSVNSVERSFDTNAAFRRAVSDIASTDKASDIALRYRGLAPISRDLANANTPEQVVDVFRSAAKTPELLSNRLPTRSFTKVPFDAIHNLVSSESDPGVLSQKLDKLTRIHTKIPEAWDKDLQSFSTKGFSLGDDFGAQGLYRQLRVGQTKDVAERVMNEYLMTPDVGKRMDIVRNAYMDLLDNMGIPNDPEIRNNVFHQLTDATGGAQMGRGSGPAFGYDVSGRRVDLMPSDSDPLTGEKFGAYSHPILPEDQPKVSFMDYRSLKDAQRAGNLDSATGMNKMLAQFKSVYGKTDNWVLRNYTQKFFKSLTLMTGGFAMRVAGGEIVPIGLRDGFGNLFESRLAASYAKYGYDIATDPESVSSLRAAVWKTVRPLTDRLDVGSEEFAKRVDTAMASIAYHGGDVVNDALSAGHHYSGMAPGGWNERLHNAVGQLLREVPDGSHVGELIGKFDGADINDLYAWQKRLDDLKNSPSNQRAAQAWLETHARGVLSDVTPEEGAQRAFKAWLDEQPEGSLDHNLRHFESTTPGSTPHEDWARVLTQNFKGSLYDAEGNPNVPLIQALANGETPSLETLQGMTDKKPAKLLGELKPKPFDSTLTQRIVNAGHEHVLSPMINWLSREPIYQDHVFQQMESLTKAGLDPSEALPMAEQRASHDMIRMVHNLNERTYFSQAAENYFPFFFAQQQAWRRMGTLLAQDPGAFRRYQLISSGLMNLGHTTQDGAGNSMLRYPGLGMLTSGATAIAKRLGIPMIAGIPTAFTGSVTSLGPALPLTEQDVAVSPLVAISMNSIRSMFPELAPITNRVAGDIASQESTWNLLIPNSTLRGVMQAIRPSDADRGYANATLHSIQWLEYQQQQHPDQNIVPPPGASPLVQQQFIDKVKSTARVMMLMKAGLGLLTPTAPIMSVGDMNLSNEVGQLIQQKGVSEGIHAFLEEHPNADAYTVFNTETTADQPMNAPLASTSEAGKWIEQNLDTVKKYGYGGVWLVPQTPGNFDRNTYNDQLALGLRKAKAPEDYLKQLYTTIGDNTWYDKILPQFDAALKQVQGDATLTNRINQGKAQLKSQLEAQNPVWAENNRSGSQKDVVRQNVIADFRKMMADEQAGNPPPASPQWDGIKQLVGAYDAFTAASLPGRRDRVATDMRKKLQAGWDQLMTQIANTNPELSAVATGVFKQIQFGEA